MSTPLRPLPDHDPLKASEVAAALGTSHRSVLQGVYRGRFPNAIRHPGGHWRIPRDDVIAVGRELGVFDDS